MPRLAWGRTDERVSDSLPFVDRNVDSRKVSDGERHWLGLSLKNPG